MTYEQIALLMALAFLAGTLARPARAMVRSLIRAHKAAKRAARAARPRRGRRTSTHNQT